MAVHTAVYNKNIHDERRATKDCSPPVWECGGLRFSGNEQADTPATSKKVTIYLVKMVCVFIIILYPSIFPEIIRCFQQFS